MPDTNNGPVTPRNNNEGDIMKVNGKELAITVDDAHVTVNNAKVVKTDVAASNGIIHVIDTVVLPN